MEIQSKSILKKLSIRGNEPKIQSILKPAEKPLHQQGSIKNYKLTLCLPHIIIKMGSMNKIKNGWYLYSYSLLS